MSYANLNTQGVLRCKSLVLDGTPFSSGGGIPNLTTNPVSVDTGNGAVAFGTTVTAIAGGATAVFEGAPGTMNLALNIPPGSGIPNLTTTPASVDTGAVAVDFSTTVTTTAGAATAVFTGAAGAMNLALNIPHGGGGTTVPTLWADTSAYAVGDVVSTTALADPDGTFICIAAVTAPVSPAVNPAPAITPASWTPVAPLKSVATLPAGAMVLGGQNTSGASASGAWATGVLYAPGAVVYDTDNKWYVCYTQVIAGVASATSPSTDVAAGSGGVGTYWEVLAPAYNVGGGGGAVAWGVLTVPAGGSPTTAFVILSTGTAAAGEVALATGLVGGVIPASFATTNMMIASWVGGTTPAPPANAILVPTFTASASATMSCGVALSAGQQVTWALF